ncbi:MAG: hypothetical protein GY730_02215 [bacterium]|nr:hypothetical protein [bacterium]
MDIHSKKNDTCSRKKGAKKETVKLECNLKKIDKKKRHKYKRENTKKFYEYLKSNNLEGKLGEAWVWSGIDPESKYLFPDIVGTRKRNTGIQLVKRIKEKRANSKDKLLIQTDDYDVYAGMIKEVFASKIKTFFRNHRNEIVPKDVEMPENILYAVLKKKRSNAGEIEEIAPKIVFGKDKDILAVLKSHNSTQGINTSYIERNNLNRRLFNARLRRKTITISKDYDCLIAQLNLQRIYANFCWNHHTLSKQFGSPTTPAMAIGKTKGRWNLIDIFFYPIT